LPASEEQVSKKMYLAHLQDSEEDLENVYASIFIETKFDGGGDEKNNQIGEKAPYDFVITTKEFPDVDPKAPLSSEFAKYILPKWGSKVNDDGGYWISYVVLAFRPNNPVPESAKTDGSLGVTFVGIGGSVV